MLKRRQFLRKKFKFILDNKIKKYTTDTSSFLTLSGICKVLEGVGGVDILVYIQIFIFMNDESSTKMM